ncbi:MAG TPA: hypothetical protein VJ881_09790, partial [Halanaerobiales bacterium]|nr:hypothetical protein [Halanaerobiales bacterium]
EMPFVVEGSNLVYEMEGRQIEITQDQIDTINNYILSDNSYLKTEVINSLPVGIKADIYLATTNNDTITKNELYTSSNKVNSSSVIEINGSDGEAISSENKFILGDNNGEEGLLTKIEDAVKSRQNIFIGFKFKLGDVDSDEFIAGEKTYSFSDDQNIDTKAHLGITVKVNQ